MKSYEKKLLSSSLFYNIEEKKSLSLLQMDGMKEYIIPKGDILDMKGSFSQSLIYIIKGSIQVTKGGHFHSVIINTLDKEQFFGMATLFFDGSSKNNVESQLKALERTKILLFTKDWIENAFQLEPQLAVNYIAVLSERIRFLNERIDAYTCPEPRETLRKYLLSLLENRKEHETIIMECSMTQLARKLNVSRASLYRCFQWFIDEKIIMRNAKNITILNIEKLRSEVEL